MKRLYIFSLIFTLAVISASAQITKLFEQYSDTENVTTVYISKTMINMMPNMATTGIEIKEIAGKVNGINVLTTENTALASKIDKEVKEQIKKDGYEILLSANDNGEKAIIYLKTEKNGINNYLIVAQEPTEFTIVLITGTFTASDIQKMTSK